jgi:putative holliday junction resolvase
MRAMAIDFGEKRIGLAVSDASGCFSLPSATLERTTDRRAVYEIAARALAEEVGILILGLPRTPDGQDSDSTDRVRRFGQKLEKATRLKLIYVDETLTTVEAIALLAAAGHSAGRPGQAEDGRRDALAASILLQEAIDRGLTRAASPTGEK